MRSASVEVGWNMRTGRRSFSTCSAGSSPAGSACSAAAPARSALAYVAAGRSDAFIEYHINSWDCLAGNLLVAEAGGYVNDFLGSDGLTQGQCAARLHARPRAIRSSRSPRAEGFPL